MPVKTEEPQLEEVIPDPKIEKIEEAIIRTKLLEEKIEEVLKKKLKE